MTGRWKSLIERLPICLSALSLACSVLSICLRTSWSVLEGVKGSHTTAGSVHGQPPYQNKRPMFGPIFDFFYIAVSGSPEMSKGFYQGVGNSAQIALRSVRFHPKCRLIANKWYQAAPTGGAAERDPATPARSTLEGNDAQENYMYMWSLRTPWEIAKTTHVKPKRPNRG